MIDKEKLLQFLNGEIAVCEDEFNQNAKKTKSYIHEMQNIRWWNT